MIIHTMPQYSPSWWRTRCGKPTASAFDKIISRKKPFLLKDKGAESYICELIADVANLNPNFFTEKGNVRSHDIERGRQTEAEARSWFEMETGHKVEQVGFVEDDDEQAGGSPDGLIGLHPDRFTLLHVHDDYRTFHYTATGEESGLELKCPKRETQVRYLLTPDKVPTDYIPQVHFSLALTGFKEWHFLAYCPGLDPVHVIEKPNEYTAHCKTIMAKFLEMYHERLHKLCPAAAVVAEWRKFLRNDPPLDEFNAKLPEMALCEYTTKKRLWDLVQAHAKKANLVFDSASKTFHTAQPVEEFF